MNEEKIRQAVEYLKSGDKENSRGLLAQVVKIDPCNEAAWLWLAASVDEPDQRRFCLQRALAINPENIRARQMLAKTGALSGPVNMITSQAAQPSVNSNSSSPDYQTQKPNPALSFQGNDPSLGKPGSGSLGSLASTNALVTQASTPEQPSKKPDSGRLGRLLAAGLAAAVSGDQPAQKPDSGSLGRRITPSTSPSPDDNVQPVKKTGSGGLGSRMSSNSSGGYEAPIKKPDSGSLNRRGPSEGTLIPPVDNTPSAQPASSSLPPWMETTTQIRVRSDTPEVPRDQPPLQIEAPVQAFLARLKAEDNPFETPGNSDRMSAYLPSSSLDRKSGHLSEDKSVISPEKVMESEIAAGLSLEDYQRYEEALEHYNAALQIDVNCSEAMLGKGRCLAWLTHIDGVGLDEGLQLIHGGWKKGDVKEDDLVRTGDELSSVLDLYTQAVLQEMDHSADGAEVGNEYSSQEFLQLYAIRILKTMALAWQLAPCEKVESIINKSFTDIQNSPMISNTAKQSFNKRFARIDREMHPQTVGVQSPKANKKDHCFIATASMGDINHPDVVVLRQWRDLRLSGTRVGRWFIVTYYAISPPIAKWISQGIFRQRLCRVFLVRPAAWFVRRFLG